jgi:hypothetical protein
MAVRCNRSSAAKASGKDIVLSFYDGQLFRIVVKYDGRETEGLTANDMVEAISPTYGRGNPHDGEREDIGGPLLR